MFRGKNFTFTNTILLLFYIFTTIGFAQSGPQPGDVYKEFDLVNTGNNWRVTDPNATHPGAGDFLPNSVLNLSVDDLQDAIKAELVIDLWGGHPGTTDKRFRFNNNSWVTIPELTSTPAEGYKFMHQYNPVVPVNLSHIVEGNNTLEGTSGGQAVYNFGWGQWGWYGVILRVYYDPNSKPHPNGSITSFSNGGNFNDNPLVSASASSSAGIKQVEFLGYYEGYDLDGDGIFQEWQGYYHREYSDTEMELKGNIGTDFSAPYSSSWNTSWVPDQVANSVKLQARIQDNNGIWYVTESVENLSLVRNDFSVKLFKGINIPERYWVPWGGGGDPRSRSSNFSIPTSVNLSSIAEARYFVRTWGNDEGSLTYSTLLNGNGISNHGLDHFYKLDNFAISKSLLQNGTNTVRYQSNSTHHGIEILWPGPAVMLKFGSVTNFPPSISQQPANQSVIEGGIATFSVTATGTNPLRYQWKKNGSNIGGAINSTYTTPATTLTDNGAQYSVVVSNSYGSVTSSSATLNVINIGPGGTNISQNGDFEAGSTSGWITGNHYGGADYTFALNSSSPISGSFDGKVTIQNAGTATSRPLITNILAANLIVGQQYTISFDTKVISGSPSIGFINYGGGFVPFPSSTLSGTQTWTFNLASATEANSDIYIYVNGTSVGSFAIDNVTVTAASVGGDPPIITNQPQSVLVNLGDAATFNIVATGTNPLRYQWKKNGSNIGGAINSTYTTPATTLTDNGAQYSVVVSNSYGSVTSSSATLNVINIGPGGTNISQNGDFEAGSTSGWITGNHYGGADYTFALNSSSPISGSFDGKVTIQNAGTATSRPLITNILAANLIVGQQYTISFDTKVISGSPSIGFINYGGGFVPFPSSTLSGTQTWTFNLASATEANSDIYIYVNGTSVGSFAIDNVKVEKVNNNLSINGNFEDGTLSNWLSGNHFGGAVYSFDVNSGAPISGSYDGKLSVLTPGTANSRPMLANKLSETLVLGQSYTVTFKTKVISGLPTIGYINYGLGVKSFTSNLSGTETWAFDVPSATSAIGYLYIYVDGRSAGTFTIDDVVVFPVGAGALASNSMQTQNQNNFEIYVQDGSSFNFTTQQLSNYFGQEISIASNSNQHSAAKVDAADSEAITHTMFDKNKRNDIRVFAYQKNEVEVTDHRIETKSLNSNQLVSRSIEELPLVIESNETVVIELEDQLLSLGFDLEKVNADVLESENSSNVAVSIKDGKLMLTAINVEEEVSFDLPLVLYDGESKLLKENISTTLQPTSTESEIPTDFVLSQNYPNPFNPSTTIKFGLPADSEVNLTIYNLLGEVVNVIANETKGAGYYEYTWNASNFAAGVYIYRFSATSQETGENFVRTKKLMLLK